MLNTEQKIHQLINPYRSSKNLPMLEPNEKISQLARKHSEAMANKKIKFGNSGFKKRIRRIALFLPNKAASENIAAYQGNPVSEEKFMERLFNYSGKKLLFIFVFISILRNSVVIAQPGFGQRG